MVPTPSTRRTGRRARARRWPFARRDDARGQSLVEFALILTPLIFLILAIIQFGFIFQAYITVANAVREGARDASLYVYDTAMTQTQNDTCRNEMARGTMLGAMNGLVRTTPNLANTGTHTCSAGAVPTGTWTLTTNTATLIVVSDGDLRITYELPETTVDNDPRSGWRMSVKANYHLNIIVPLVAALLPKDANGRFVVGAESTMVLN